MNKINENLTLKQISLICEHEKQIFRFKRAPNGDMVYALIDAPICWVTEDALTWGDL